MNVTVDIIFFDLVSKKKTRLCFESFINPVPFRSSLFILLLLHFCKKTVLRKFNRKRFVSDTTHPQMKIGQATPIQIQNVPVCSSDLCEHWFAEHVLG